MENFVPGLREAVLSLAHSLRVVVFFVCTAGLMLHVHRARTDIERMAAPVVRAMAVVALVATLPHWFGFTENLFLGIAERLNEGYTQHPMQTATQVRAMVGDTGDEWSFRKVGESLYKAVLHGAAKLVVLIASLLQLPFLVLQHILKLLCYLFLPIALGLFMLPGQASLGTRYLQQTLAVLSWPVGFAVTELVAYNLLTAYTTNLATAYGLMPGEINAASFGSLLGGLLAGLWLILGTVATPFLMQGLICSGTPISGGGQPALQQFYALHQISWLLKGLKTGGATAMAKAASAGMKPGESSGGGGPLPPAPPPTPPLPPAAPPAAADPAGDQRAASALASSQLPAPQTTI